MDFAPDLKVKITCLVCEHQMCCEANFIICAKQPVWMLFLSYAKNLLAVALYLLSIRLLLIQSTHSNFEVSCFQKEKSFLA